MLTVPEREGMLQWLLLHNHTPVPLWDRNQLQLSKFQEEAVKRNNNNNCLETTRPKIAEDLTSVDLEPYCPLFGYLALALELLWRLSFR